MDDSYVTLYIIFLGFLGMGEFSLHANQGSISREWTRRLSELACVAAIQAQWGFVQEQSFSLFINFALFPPAVG